MSYLDLFASHIDQNKNKSNSISPSPLKTNNNNKTKQSTPHTIEPTNKQKPKQVSNKTQASKSKNTYKTWKKNTTKSTNKSTNQPNLQHSSVKGKCLWSDISEITVQLRSLCLSHSQSYYTTSNPITRWQEVHRSCYVAITLVIHHLVITCCCVDTLNMLSNQNLWHAIQSLPKILKHKDNFGWIISFNLKHKHSNNK